jgi:DNA-binding transcriptional regulator YdaS (Cro superfamily)
MQLIDWLKAERGRATKLALHLEVSNATISEWANKRKPIPVDRCTPIESFTGSEVGRKCLRSDWEVHWPELIAGESAYPTSTQAALSEPHPQLPPGVTQDRRDPTRINPFPDLDRRSPAGEG